MFEIRTGNDGHFASTEDSEIARAIAELARCWYGAQVVMVWDSETGYRVDLDA